MSKKKKAAEEFLQKLIEQAVPKGTPYERLVGSYVETYNLEWWQAERAVFYEGSQIAIERMACEDLALPYDPDVAPEWSLN